MSNNDEYGFYSEAGARVAAIIAYTVETAYTMDVPIEDLMTAVDLAIDRMEDIADAQTAKTH